MRLKEDKAIFAMIDIQEAFGPFIPELEQVIKTANILNKSAEILGIPLVVTEQYPKGLGKTCENINIPETANIFEKNLFSIFAPEVKEYIKSTGKTQIVLYGIESHVCLMQSSLDALDLGLEVFYVEDGVASRDDRNKVTAIRRLSQLGVQVVSSEMLLFEIMQSSKHPHFREISKLVK